MDVRHLPDKSYSADELRFAELRRRMVNEQLVARGIHDRLVLNAMLEVPRHEFVLSQWWSEAYEDWPLPIGYGQTISQPLTVAYMLQALKLRGHERVLEVGTGSGYAAAVLSRLAKEVYSVERIPELAEEAAKKLDVLGYSNVEVHTADGTIGLPSRAPFDAIVVAAGAEQLPAPYLEQLSATGRIVIPVGDRTAGQNLMRYSFHAGKLIDEDLGRFAFVPLIGKFGWTPTAS